jgi:hypothetical protein
MRFDVYKVELGMYPASIINFLSNDDTPPFRAGSVIVLSVNRFIDASGNIAAILWR